jgi:hypothetical protein
VRPMSGAVRGCGGRRKEERRGGHGSEQKRQKHTLHRATLDRKIQTL